VPSEGGGMTEKLTRDMVEAARIIAEKTGALWTDQLNNTDQLAAYHQMAEEIWTQTGGQLEIEEFLAFFELLLEVLGLLEDLDAGAVEAGEHIVELSPSRQISGQNFTHFVVEDVAFFLAHLHEPLQPVEFVI
jgi:hypothetical protein